jgi:hypothetical protein
MRKSSLFRDKNRVGKGSWQRKCDNAKVGETIERLFGEWPVNPPMAGRKQYKVVNGELVEVGRDG